MGEEENAELRNSYERYNVYYFIVIKHIKSTLVIKYNELVRYCTSIIHFILFFYSI